MILKRLGMAAGLVLISANIAAANFQNGQKAFDNNDFATAIDEWRSSANQGNSQAQLKLGELFEKGADGLDADIISAYAWLKLAASQGMQDAENLLERVKSKMTPEEIIDGNAQAVAGLGVWYRQHTDQDEDAFQQAKAEAAINKQQGNTDQIDAAKERAERQKALIAQRKAEAKELQRQREEERQAAIRAAQLEAEEAKRAAFELQKKIDEDKRVAALEVEHQKQQEMNAARARLNQLKSKQLGEAPAQSSTSRSKSTVIAQAAVAPVTATSSLGVKASGVETGPKVSAVPDKNDEIVQVALAPSIADKPGGSSIALQDTKYTEQKISITSTDKASSSVFPLKDMSGLNEQVVVQIFEDARSVPLESDSAQAEITDSLVRIDALKWSLIAGAKGDKSAPKMNKVLMSTMSPVQIAEANRLASEWLVKRQKRL
jgi:K+/H+ antiporter YhaU regulatory subunit KhtT